MIAITKQIVTVGIVAGTIVTAQNLPSLIKTNNEERSFLKDE